VFGYITDISPYFQFQISRLLFTPQKRKQANVLMIKLRMIFIYPHFAIYEIAMVKIAQCIKLPISTCKTALKKNYINKYNILVLITVNAF